MYGHTYSKSMDQPDKVANPARRDQLNTETAPKDPLIRWPHAWDEASVIPVRTCRVASYHGAPFSRALTSNHLSISNRRQLRSDTTIDGKLFRPPKRVNAVIWRYIWCVYRLADGAATDILIHFPACFSSWLNDILRLSIASRRIASSFSSLSSGTWSMRCAVSQPTPRKTRTSVVARDPEVRHPKVVEPRRGGYVFGSQVLGYRVTKAMVYVRGSTPPEAQYRPNVVHFSPV